MSDKTYATPTKVTDLEIAFSANLGPLLPEMEQIPEDFKRDRGAAKKWIAVQQQWFYRGLKGSLVAKSGIDRDLALRHLKCIQGSYQPKHEHKEAAVAWLMSLWFDDYVETAEFAPSDSP